MYEFEAGVGFHEYCQNQRARRNDRKPWRQLATRSILNSYEPLCRFLGFGAREALGAQNAGAEFGLVYFLVNKDPLRQKIYQSLI